jgi:hypothetical protein
VRSTRFLLTPAFALLLGLVTACGGDPTDRGGAADAGSPDGGQATGASGGDLPAPAAEPVDVCALFTDADFTAVFGATAAGAAQSAAGSFLGGCDYFTDDASAAASVSARPIDEYQATVDAYEVAPVEGVPFDAVFDQGVGMFVRFDGEPWFLHVLAYGPGGTPGQWDQALSVQVATAVDANR